MIPWKGALYAATLLGAFFCGFRAMKIREALTEDAILNNKNVADSGMIRDQFVRGRYLKTLDSTALRSYRFFQIAKLVLVALLVVEVILLQSA